MAKIGHDAHAKWSVWVKKQLQKTHKIRKNESIFIRAKICPDAWAIAQAKWSVFVKDLKR